MPARIFRAFLPLAAITLGLLPGCPVRRTCPNCEYRTATFDASDVEDWTSAVMETKIDHDASSSSQSCPIEGDPSPCVTNRPDENVLCRVKQLDGGKATVMLSLKSLSDAAHSVTLQVKKGSTSQTLTTTNVGAPTSTSVPLDCK